MRFCLQETTSSCQVKEVGTWCLPVVNFLSPQLLRLGERPLFCPVLKGPVSGYSQPLPLCLERLEPRSPGLKRLGTEAGTSGRPLGCQVCAPPSPFRSWSCDLLFSWMRGSLFLLFFCLLRKGALSQSA